MVLLLQLEQKHSRPKSLKILSHRRGMHTSRYVKLIIFLQNGMKEMVINL